MSLSVEKVRKAQGGDDESVEEVVAYFMPRLKAYANSYFILGGDKEDVIQEGMLGLFFALRDYKEELSGFETFALMCIKSRILTALRLANGQKHRALNTSVDITERDEPSVSDPMEVILKREWRDAFYKAVEKDLSKTERLVVGFYLQGYGYTEIALLAGMSAKSVDNALQRARKKLVNIIGLSD